MSVVRHATGLQHIGIPTEDIQATIGFYTELGFEIVQRSSVGSSQVVFLRLGDLVVETWEGRPTGQSGAIDHFAINVTDIDAVFRSVRNLGFTALEGGVRELPFWERGVRYFTICGANSEKVEFIQIL